MRKFLILLLLAFLIVPLSNAITVDRTMDPAVNFDQVMEITFVINPEDTQNFELTDAVPVSWQIQSWDVTGVPKGKVVFSSEITTSLDQQREIFKWRFENITSPVQLTYTIIPKTVGEQTLIALWEFENTFESEESEIFVRGAGTVCGNDICESGFGENNVNCAEDCKYKTHEYFWLGILLLATIVLILGIAYREYKKNKVLRRQERLILRIRPTPKQPVKIIQFKLKPKSKRVETIKPKSKALKKKPRKKPKKKVKTKKAKVRAKRMTSRSKKRIVKKKPKRTAKKKPKIKKITKKKTTKKTRRTKDKHEKLYKDTLSRLKKIKKELK